MPLSVVEIRRVPTRLSLSRSTMVSSRDMEKRLSFQTTIKSRMLSSPVASEIILVNSSRLPAVSLNVAETVRSLDSVGYDASGCCQGILDVDGGLLHGVAS